LTLLELDCDFPCAESIFSAEHPFVEEDFTFNRRLQMSEGMKILLEKRFDDIRIRTGPNRPALLYLRSEDMNCEYTLTILDLVIIIHRMALAPLFRQMIIQYARIC